MSAMFFLKLAVNVIIIGAAVVAVFRSQAFIALAVVFSALTAYVEQAQPLFGFGTDLSTDGTSYTVLGSLNPMSGNNWHTTNGNAAGITGSNVYAVVRPDNLTYSGFAASTGNSDGTSVTQNGPIVRGPRLQISASPYNTSGTTVYYSFFLKSRTSLA